MSQRLEQGYRYLARQFTASNGKSTLMAPASPVFRGAYQEEPARGVDPKSELSLFRQLYVDDSHPSVAGTYLTAFAIVGFLFDVSVSEAKLGVGKA